MQYRKALVFLSALFFSSYTLGQTYQGTLRILIYDDFAHNKSKTIYQLRDATGSYSLDFPSSIDKSKLLSGSEVILEGTEIPSVQNHILKVQSIVVKKNDKQEEANPSITTANRSVLAILVNFTNLKATKSLSVSDVDRILFTGPQSLQKNFQNNSFNQINFVRDTNNDGKPDIYVVNLNYAATDCNPEKWAADAESAAVHLGVNTSLYTHHMFILPPWNSCPWGGVGEVGCGSVCYTWVNAYNLPGSESNFSHEIGHNLGLSHSSLDTNNDGINESEYGDTACIMGGNYNKVKEMNAPHRDQLHWFDSFPRQLTNITQSKVYTLNALEQGVTATQPITLKIRRNAKDTFYISYRQNIGAFGPGENAYLNRINIHRTTRGDNHSYFIKSLGKGEQFFDNKTNISISAVATGGSSPIVTVTGTIYVPQLTSCIYSTSKTTVTCTAIDGLLSIGGSGDIFRSYSGPNCAMSGQSYNSPGNASLTDTQYVSQSKVLAATIGCNVKLCNTKSCNDMRTSAALIIKGP